MTIQKFQIANCPLCDSAEVSIRAVRIDMQLMHAVSCKDCGLIGPAFFPTTDCKAEEQAIILWNDRPEKIRQ